MTKALAKANVGTDVLWEHDAQRGGINDGKYSQRNPQSRLSVLTADDFEYIQTFFS